MCLLRNPMTPALHRLMRRWASVASLCSTDVLEAAIGAPHQPPVVGGVGRLKSHDGDVGAQVQRIDDGGQRLRAKQRRVRKQHNDMAHVTGNRGASGLDGIGGAELALLDENLRVPGVGSGLGCDRVHVRPGDHGELGYTRRLRCRQHVPEHRQARQLMQHLGPVRLHAGAFAGTEHYGEKRSGRHAGFPAGRAQACGTAHRYPRAPQPIVIPADGTPTPVRWRPRMAYTMRGLESRQPNSHPQVDCVSGGLHVDPRRRGRNSQTTIRRVVPTAGPPRPARKRTKREWQVAVPPRRLKLSPPKEDGRVASSITHPGPRDPGSPAGRSAPIYLATWAFLALMALSYLALLALRPDVATNLIGGPFESAPEGNRGQRAMTRALAELNGVKQTAARLEGEVAELRKAVAAERQSGQALQARVATLEARSMAGVPVAQAPLVAAPASGAIDAAIAPPVAQGHGEERTQRAIRESRQTEAPRDPGVIAPAAAVQAGLTPPAASTKAAEVKPKGAVLGLWVGTGPSLELGPPVLAIAAGGQQGNPAYPRAALRRERQRSRDLPVDCRPYCLAGGGAEDLRAPARPPAALLGDPVRRAAALIDQDWGQDCGSQRLGVSRLSS